MEAISPELVLVDPDLAERVRSDPVPVAAERPRFEGMTAAGERLSATAGTRAHRAPALLLVLMLSLCVNGALTSMVLFRAPEERPAPGATTTVPPRTLARPPAAGIIEIPPSPSGPPSGTQP